MADVTHVDRASQAWLTDPTVFEVNRTPAHSSHKWYARDPQSGQWSDLKQSLDGEWRVEVVQAADINLEEEPATAESFDDSSFERIQVPGHLQTAGLMNHKYVNVQYPWDGHENPLEPNIPENNHVALYRRKFTVSAPVANAKQAGGSVSIVFHGMATAIYVWVNGAFVGYGEDGFTPNEFDITELLHDGENVVAVACYEYSSASWLEDQDFWRLHGLFRSVELAARPHVHIENTQIEADWDPEAGTASLDAALTVLNAADAATVRAT
jgi:Beta-galactosidase/beta-glucuronidase